MSLSPNELRRQLKGLFSFPVTPFTENLEIDVVRFREHLQWMIAGKPAALFVCGGTGEFFFSRSCGVWNPSKGCSRGEAAGRLPVIGGVGYGTRLAQTFAKVAENAGADGLLVLPPYLLQAEQQGLYEHYSLIAAATKLGMIVYQRANAVLDPETVVQLCEQENIIGLKDGYGDMDLLLRIQKEAGDRLVIINGMPTAELSAAAFKGLGIVNYSSAVFNFVPSTARVFYEALVASDTPTMDRMLEAFYRPLAKLRDRRKGYAVSLIKAGLRAVGKSAGQVRAPLVECSLQEEAELKLIIKKGIDVVSA